jgi:hypothetical protein
VAGPLFAGVLVVSIIALAYQRFQVTSAAVFPATVALAAFALVGWPLLTYDSSWIAFSNGDSQFYIKTAERLAAGGFFKVPTMDSMVFDTNPETRLFFAHAIHGGDRPLFELFLALLSSLARLPVISIYMAFMVSLYATQALATCAIAEAICRSRSRMRNARQMIVITALLALASAPTVLGFCGELGPQIIGVSVFAALVAVMHSSPNSGTPRQPLSPVFLYALLIATLLAGYTELLPLAILATIIGSLTNTTRLKSPKQLISIGRQVVPILLLIAVFLNTHLLALYFTVKGGLSGGSRATDAVAPTFPQYLIPTGLGTLWGIAPATSDGDSTLSQSAIAVGFALLLAVVIYSIVTIRSATGLASTTLAMAIAAGILFAHQSDFGVYKLAMYAQPFLITSLASLLSVSATRVARISATIITCFLFTSSVSTSSFYLARSVDGGSDHLDSFVNVRYGTQHHLIAALSTARRITSGMTVISDATNQGFLEYARMLLGAKVLADPAFESGQGFESPLKGLPFFRGLTSSALILTEYQKRFFRTATFNLSQSGPHLMLQQDLRPNKFSRLSDRLTLLTGTDGSVFNHCLLSDALDSRSFEILRGARNVVLPSHSTLIPNLTVDQPNPPTTVSKDRFFGGEIAPIGNYLLLQVENPSTHLRLLLDYTSTLNINKFKKIPRIFIYGEKSYEIDTSGEGRLRTLSPEVQPRMINGTPYLVLHIEAPAFRFYQHRHGLDALYGANLTVDAKHLVGFIRDLSLVDRTDETRCLLRDPAPLPFMSGIAEYSGIFEDRWLSNDVTISALPGERYNQLTLVGSQPYLPALGENELTISRQGHKVASFHLRPGDFAKSIELPEIAPAAPLRLHFKLVVPPNPGDARELSVRLDKLVLGYKR